MSEPDLSPVKPYPGFPGAGEASPAKGSSRPRVEPAEPRAWSTTLPLAFPRLVDGELLDTLTISRLTGREVADLIIEDDDEVSLNARARARMASVHPDVIEALEANDAEAFAEKCRPLLPAALAAIEERIRAELDLTI